MKNSILAVSLGCSVLAVFLNSNEAYAVDGLSANIAVTNNYLWRGLEQTNGKSAVSGGIDYASDSGFYAGTWVSNADWADEMSYEMDFYGGFAGEVNGFGYDLGVIYYAYPDSKDDVDFSEVTASISYGVFSLSYAVLADAEGADFADDSYLAGDVTFELVSEIELTLHIGTGTDDFYAGESFVDYSASLNKSGFTFGLSKTDLSNEDMKVFISYGIDIDL